MVRNFAGRAAQELSDRVVAQVKVPTAPQIEYAGQGQHARDGALMRREAQGKLSARGMSGDAHSAQIELGVAIVGLPAQSTVGAADIFKASRPSPARISHTAILDIPGGQARTLQRMTEMAGVGQVILSAPVAAMNKEDQWMRSFTGRQPNVCELIWICAVGEPKVRLRRLLSQDVFTLHGSAKYRTGLCRSAKPELLTRRRGEN